MCRSLCMLKMRRKTDTKACCPFKRGQGDSLLDKEDGKYYCGACWQKWIQAHAKLREPNTSTRQKAENVDGEVILTNGDRKESDGGDVSQDADDESSPKFPFVVQDDRDHCETPLTAYSDIEPILSWLSTMLGKSKAQLQIYDPYFCSGAVVKRLKTLGFDKVYNKCEDFYAVQKQGRVPDYDVIVVNPPYSTSPIDHVEKLLEFLVKQSKPCFVLQPNYVYTKPFWEKLTSRRSPRPFFLTPPTPRSYIYDTPRMIKGVKSKQRKTSPFVTMWYCHVGENTEAFYRWWAEKGATKCKNLTIACSEYLIANKFKDSSDRTRRKQRKRKRKDDDGENDKRSKRGRRH
eukprot:Plantae.Rhodophyta-Hildenbrandia_rubra.ctg16346.p1 GENE.Plantae.Rhodophyta-Hildenbrandia_rubra.ctg16346~~Plantae.Rhodophyta-Hildenbrandia_rubra.ctg16346.p1  ORF type:complete len:346 (+),score=62.45 Plantae.Rhodophyta-Hildenbrandia_rubra.ctg16346:219-1256(+)